MKRLIFIFALCVSSNVSAQISLPNIQVSDFPDPVINSQIDTQIIFRNPVSEQDRSPASQEPAISFVYASSKSRTRDNLQNIVSRWRKQNPAHGTQLEQLLAENDVIGAVGDVMGQFGLQRNNVAHAYTLYSIVYWGLANGIYDAPSSQTVQSVAAQVEQSFGVDPKYAAMNDAEKQAAAEELMVLTAILDGGSQEAKTNPAMAAQLAKAALENGRKVGFELDKMKLTEQGFVIEPL
jgi:hypothetical protein